MPVYAWKGLNTAGKAVGGTKDADGPKALRATLRRDGVYVTEHREMLGGAAAARGGRRRGGRGRPEGVAAQARGRHPRPVRTRPLDGHRGVHAPARDAAARRHPAGRGADRAVRAGRQSQAGGDPDRGAPEGERGELAGRHAGAAPDHLPRPLHEHGPLGRSRREPGRRAHAARRLHGCAERAAREGGRRADLSHHHDDPGRRR